MAEMLNSHGQGTTLESQSNPFPVEELSVLEKITGSIPDAGHAYNYEHEGYDGDEGSTGLASTAPQESYNLDPSSIDVIGNEQQRMYEMEGEATRLLHEAVAKSRSLPSRPDFRR